MDKHDKSMLVSSINALGENKHKEYKVIETIETLVRLSFSEDDIIKCDRIIDKIKDELAYLYCKYTEVAALINSIKED